MTHTVGCDLLERTSKLKSLHKPKVSLLRTPKVWLLPNVSTVPPKGVWAFRSRPDLSPAAVQVTTQAHDDTAPGYVFVAVKEGAGEHGPMIIDDLGRFVWFGKHRAARDFKSDFEMGPGTQTAFQHGARRQQDGTIAIFDYGAHPKVHDQSRGMQ